MFVKKIKFMRTSTILSLMLSVCNYAVASENEEKGTEKRPLSEVSGGTAENERNQKKSKNETNAIEIETKRPSLSLHYDENGGISFVDDNADMEAENASNISPHISQLLAGITNPKNRENLIRKLSINTDIELINLLEFFESHIKDIYIKNEKELFSIIEFLIHIKAKNIDFSSYMNSINSKLYAGISNPGSCEDITKGTHEIPIYDYENFANDLLGYLSTSSSLLNREGKILLYLAQMLPSRRQHYIDHVHPLLAKTTNQSAKDQIVLASWFITDSEWNDLSIFINNNISIFPTRHAQKQEFVYFGSCPYDFLESIFEGIHVSQWKHFYPLLTGLTPLVTVRPFQQIGQIQQLQILQQQQLQMLQQQQLQILQLQLLQQQQLQLIHSQFERFDAKGIISQFRKLSPELWEQYSPLISSLIGSDTCLSLRRYIISRLIRLKNDTLRFAVLKSMERIIDKSAGQVDLYEKFYLFLHFYESKQKVFQDVEIDVKEIVNATPDIIKKVSEKLFLDINKSAHIFGPSNTSHVLANIYNTISYISGQKRQEFSNFITPFLSVNADNPEDYLHKINKIVYSCAMVPEKSWGNFKIQLNPLLDILDSNIHNYIIEKFKDLESEDLINLTQIIKSYFEIINIKSSIDYTPCLDWIDELNKMTESRRYFFNEKALSLLDDLKKQGVTNENCIVFINRLTWIPEVIFKDVLCHIYAKGLGNLDISDFNKTDTFIEYLMKNKIIKDNIINYFLNNDINKVDEHSFLQSTLLYIADNFESINLQKDHKIVKISLLLKVSQLIDELFIDYDSSNFILNDKDPMGLFETAVAYLLAGIYADTVPLDIYSNGDQHKNIVAYLMTDPFLKETFVKNWGNLLESEDIDLASNIQDFITENFMEFGLAEVDDIVQHAIRIGILTNEDNAEDPLNPYTFFNNLKAKRLESIDWSVVNLPKQTLGYGTVTLNPTAIKQLPQNEISVKDLPKYDNQFLNKMVAQIRQRLNNPVNQLPLTVADFNILLTGSMGSNILNNFLSINLSEKDRVVTISAKLIAVVADLASQDNTLENNKFSKREDEFLTALSCIQACATGKEAGIDECYGKLPFEKKYSIDNLQPAEAFLVDAIRSEINKMLIDSSKFMLDLTNNGVNDEINQGVHQEKYIKNLIGMEIGCPQLKFDTHSQTLNQVLVARSKQEAVNIFYQHFKPATLIQGIVRTINDELSKKDNKGNYNTKLYNNLYNLFASEDWIKDSWDFDIETHLTSLKPFGAYKMLVKMGCLNECENGDEFLI